MLIRWKHHWEIYKKSWNYSFLINNYYDISNLAMFSIKWKQDKRIKKNCTFCLLEFSNLISLIINHQNWDCLLNGNQIQYDIFIKLKSNLI